MQGQPKTQAITIFKEKHDLAVSNRTELLARVVSVACNFVSVACMSLSHVISLADTCLPASPCAPCQRELVAELRATQQAAQQGQAEMAAELCKAHEAFLSPPVAAQLADSVSSPFPGAGWHPCQGYKAAGPTDSSLCTPARHGTHVLRAQLGPRLPGGLGAIKVG
jgi:hypothetical protein